jgi:hypothetical protein
MTRFQRNGTCSNPLPMHPLRLGRGTTWRGHAANDSPSYSFAHDSKAGDVLVPQHAHTRFAVDCNICGVVRIVLNLNDPSRLGVDARRSKAERIASDHLDCASQEDLAFVDVAIGLSQLRQDRGE